RGGATAGDPRLRDAQLGKRAEADQLQLLAQCVNHPQAPDPPLILEALLEGTLAVLTPQYRLDAATDPPARGPILERLNQEVALWLQCCPGRADPAPGPGGWG